MSKREFDRINAKIIFEDPNDDTKRVKFDLSSISSDNIRIITLPDADTTMVGIDINQIITNKTIDSTTNTVTADNIHSATTTIDLSSASAPSSDQVLKAISSTAATWQTLSKSDVNLSNVQNLKMKLDGITAPTSSNDVNEGYSVGSRWLDIVNDKEYVCINNSSGSAEWLNLIQTAGSSSSIFNYSYADDYKKPYIRGKSISTYRTVASFTYKGNTTISSIKVVANVGNLIGYIKIYDFTNHQTICEKSFTNTTKQAIDLGTISNLPSSDAVFELQYKFPGSGGGSSSSGGGNKYIYIYSLHGY